MAYSPVANSPAEDVRLPSATAPALSLLSVASPLPALDTNVRAASDGLPATPGLMLDRTGCVVTHGFKNCPADIDRKSSTVSGATYPFGSFTFYTSMECDYSPTPGDRLYDIARTNLEAGTAWAVSNQLQTGALNTGTTSQSPSLNAVATVVDDGGVDLDQAVGLLLAKWYSPSSGISHAGPAVLHIPPALLPDALRHSVVHFTAGGQTLEVMPGVGVSIGPGYDTTAKPAGVTTPATAAYIYLTGPVFVGLGDVKNPANPSDSAVPIDRMEGAHEPRQNKTFVIAERRAFALFDTCSVLAIAAKLPIPAP